MPAARERRPEGVKLRSIEHCTTSDRGYELERRVEEVKQKRVMTDPTVGIKDSLRVRISSPGPDDPLLVVTERIDLWSRACINKGESNHVKLKEPGSCPSNIC